MGEPGEEPLLYPPGVDFTDERAALRRAHPQLAAVEWRRMGVFQGSQAMGKGDKRTFRGKLFNGSHGKNRPGRVKRPARKGAKKYS